jgi:hypothetical protein
MFTHPVIDSTSVLGILSQENPSHGCKDDALDGWAATLGESHINSIVCENLVGKYAGTEEHSFIAFCENAAFLCSLGKLFGQGSIIFKSGDKARLIYINGPNAGKYRQANIGDTIVSYTAPDDNYSAVVGEDGRTIYFQYQFDFSDNGLLS